MENKKQLLHKPNQTIMFTDKNITATQRKAYNVILFEAHKQLIEDENKSVFLFQISELKKEAGIKASDNWHIKKDLEELSDIKISTVKNNGDWGFFRLISEVRKQGDLLSIELPTTIREAIANKNYYTTLDLLILKMLVGKYAIIIYEMAIRYHKLEIPKFTIEEFKELTGTTETKSYNNFARLKAKVIEPAIKEINRETDIELDYETETRGRKVIAIKFNILKKPKEVENKNEQKQVECKVDNNIDIDFGLFDEVKTIMQKSKLLDKDIECLLKVADNDISKIRKAHELTENAGQINNLVGFMVTAIKKEWTQKQFQNNKNKFLDYDQSGWDLEEYKKSAEEIQKLQIKEMKQRPDYIDIDEMDELQKEAKEKGVSFHKLYTQRMEEKNLKAGLVD